jgi:hypothetical protein
MYPFAQWDFGFESYFGNEYTSVISLCVYIYISVHTKALQRDDLPISTFHQISINDT